MLWSVVGDGYAEISFRVKASMRESIFVYFADWE
jgi:hypothetical protein